MSRIDDVLDAESSGVEAAELAGDPMAPPPTGTTTTHGHPRAKNLQVRFREDEFDELSAHSAEQTLPISAVVRLLVLKTIAPADDLSTARDRLATDLATARRKAPSA